jgi:predicted PurR-regulated permease PerM
LREFLSALIWATVLAVAVWPLYQRLKQRCPKRGHSLVLPGMFTLGIALIFVLPFVLAVIRAGQEARSVIAWIEAARQGGIPEPAILAQLPFFGTQVRQWWVDNLADPDAAIELLNRLNKPEYLSAGREFGIAVVHRVVIFGFCLLTVFFLFKDGDSLAEQLRRASARAFGPRGEQIGRQIVASIHGTVAGLVLVGLAEGVLLYLCYLLAGVPHPTLLGVATAIAAIVPFGAPLIFCIAALLAASQGSAVGAIAIVVAGSVIGFVADHFFRPALIGNATKLPFIWVLFGILGGVTTWGLLGLFLGPAIMAALIMLWREWTETV